MTGLLGNNNLDIQPMWVIDENAIIDLSFVWFIPIMAPVMVLIHGININVVDNLVINIRIDNGANFCHVDRIMQEIHERDAITDGNHKWHGTIPSFRRREIININRIKDLLKLIFLHIAEDIIRRSLDPIAWARKYLSIASDSWNLFELFIIGMKDNILISRAVHVISQLLLEMAIKDLIIMHVYIKIMNGDKWMYMKDLMDSNHQI